MHLSDLTESDQHKLASTMHKAFCEDDDDYTPYEDLPEKERQEVFNHFVKSPKFICSRKDIHGY